MVTSSSSYQDDTPAEYSSIVDEVTKDQEVATVKSEKKNVKDSEDKAKAAAKEMEELMKGAKEAVKTAKNEQKSEKDKEEKPVAAVIVESEGNKPITGPVEFKIDTGIPKSDPKKQLEKAEKKKGPAVLESPMIV